MAYNSTSIDITQNTDLTSKLYVDNKATATLNSANAYTN
jgi:hypothetical protein